MEMNVVREGGTTAFGSDDYVDWWVTVPGVGRQRIFRRGTGLPSLDVDPPEGTDTNENQQWASNDTLTDDGHTQGDLGNHMSSGEAAGAFMDYADAYMSYTPACVIVGNASTFSACDAFHMQIPLTWSGTQITVQLNRGQWTNFSGRYLYVITADNEVSEGFAL
jgi:hypothetical protein